MSRLAVVVLLFLPGVALGQGFSRPAGVPPGVTPAMIRPTVWATPAPFGSGVRPGAVGRYRGVLVPRSRFVGGYYGGYGGGYGYDPYSTGYAGFGYGYAPIVDYGVDLPTAVPLVAAPGFIPDGPTVDDAVPAEVAIDFPADATVTVNGQPAAGTGASRTLATRPLKPGESATLAVRATWTTGGERFEWTRTVTLGRGERSRLTVVAGVRVK